MKNTELEKLRPILLVVACVPLALVILFMAGFLENIAEANWIESLQLFFGILLFGLISSSIIFRNSDRFIGWLKKYGKYLSFIILMGLLITYFINSQA